MRIYKADTPRPLSRRTTGKTIAVSSGSVKKNFACVSTFVASRSHLYRPGSQRSGRTFGLGREDPKTNLCGNVPETVAGRVSP